MPRCPAIAASSDERGAKHRHIWPVSWLCEALEVSRAGFHPWLNRPTSIREPHDATLVTAIETSFKASDRTSGARRVWRDVLEEGLACGLHRIEQLTRINALRARPKRRGKPKDDGERSVIADNILDRNFAADRPNQKWPTDFTYIWAAEGWLSEPPRFCWRPIGPRYATISSVFMFA